MNKIQIGVKREEYISRNNKLESVFYIIGVGALCLTLVFQINEAKPGSTSASTGEYVPAMSGGVENREELNPAEKPASSVTEQSFFDELGELFAELIFGKDE